MFNLMSEFHVLFLTCRILLPSVCSSCFQDDVPLYQQVPQPYFDGQVFLLNQMDF